MQDSWYSFDVSPGWVALAFLAALGLSTLLYSKKGVPWSKTTNVIMGFLRFSAIFLIALLLLNPLLQLNINEVEKPAVIFAIDDSQSIQMRTSEAELTRLKDWINQAQEELEADYLTETFRLSESDADTISFDAKTSNISDLLSRVENVYEGRNVGAVILISDGIINQGQSPAYQDFPFPIYTLGAGDTIPPKDISISSIRNNQVAYQGNQFPVNVTLSQRGFTDETVNVRILEGSTVRATEAVALDSENKNVDFLLNAEEPGLKRLTVSVTTREGESSTANNSQDIYIDVIEGKDKVLILAPAPHPDISAIRSALDATANYETVLYIPGISERPTANDFDVVIEHQAFSRQTFPEYQATGRWYILGSGTNYKKMSEALGFININPNGNQTDQVRPAYNTSFTKFKLQEGLLDRLEGYPPIRAPFGAYQVTGPVETLFYQQVGNVVTDRPLMSFFDDGSRKAAILTGSGIWQWKLQESGSENSSELFNEMVLKTVQFLGIKANKQRFVVTPRSSDYKTGDRVFIDTEVYNDVYERTYGNTIKLTITNENDSLTNYEMVDAPANSSFNLGTMPPGIYTFQASVSLGGKTYNEQGSFAVRDIQLEGLQLTADHNLLRTISDRSGGQFYPVGEAESLLQRLDVLDPQGVVRTSQQFFPLISSIWIILLIVLLLSSEWFLRKYLGAY